MASKSSVPATMQAWKYTSADGGLDKNLRLATSEPLPKTKPTEHLVQVLAVGLNPVDYKPAEAFIGKFAIKQPATPGFDFAGRIITPAAESPFRAGDLIYGASSTNPFAGGALAQYISAPAEGVTLVPAKMTTTQAAGIPVGAVTAYSSLSSYIQAGSRVFINGGSGGVGTFAIQMAKALGANVTVSCSKRNIELCRSLGADDVFDYNERPLLEQLRAARPFDHVVDNVFSDPALYFQAHTYTTPGATFAEVAGAPSWAFLSFAIQSFLLPAFIGGGRRKFVLVMADIKQATLEKITGWSVEGKVKTVIDQTFEWEDVTAAYQRQKTGRAAGKIIVKVAEEAISG